MSGYEEVISVEQAQEEFARAAGFGNPTVRAMLGKLAPGQAGRMDYNVEADAIRLENDLLLIGAFGGMAVEIRRVGCQVWYWRKEV